MWERIVVFPFPLIADKTFIPFSLKSSSKRSNGARFINIAFTKLNDIALLVLFPHLCQKQRL